MVISVQPHLKQALQEVLHLGDEVTAVQKKIFCWYLVDTEVGKVLEMGWWNALGENISALLCFWFFLIVDLRIPGKGFTEIDL